MPEREAVRIAILNPPYRASTSLNGWITVPPQGYGAIQRICAYLIDALTAMGHEVVLLGAPGSPSRPGLTVTDTYSPAHFLAWAASSDVDILHDHSNGLLHPKDLPESTAWISTHHLTGVPRVRKNCVYVSRSQRDAAGSRLATVIPVPVDLGRYRFEAHKDDYLLFLGRVSPHKGAYEAAAFAATTGARLVLAGPSWEPAYMQRLMNDYGRAVELVGEVGGEQRLDLISRARAVMVLSQPVAGPWGHIWAEPGATVVSEAAASGTPVIATRNGCLPELTRGVGRLIEYGTENDPAAAAGALASLPDPQQIRLEARRWDHRAITGRYGELYAEIVAGRTWDDRA